MESPEVVVPELLPEIRAPRINVVFLGLGVLLVAAGAAIIRLLRQVDDLSFRATMAEGSVREMHAANVSKMKNDENKAAETV